MAGAGNQARCHYLLDEDCASDFCVAVATAFLDELPGAPDLVLLSVRQQHGADCGGWAGAADTASILFVYTLVD